MTVKFGITRLPDVSKLTPNFLSLISNVGCHFHGEFVSVLVCADDITLLAPTSTALNSMLETCFTSATAFDLRFNSSKTKCMYFSKNNKDKHDNICFVNTSIDFMECTQLLGVHISNDIANRNITSITHKFYAKVNSIMYNYRNVPSHVKAKLLSIYCLIKFIWPTIMEL